MEKDIGEFFLNRLEIFAIMEHMVKESADSGFSGQRLDSVIRSLTERMNSQAGYILVPDEDKDSLKLLACYPTTLKSQGDRLKIPIGHSLPGLAMQMEKVICKNYFDEDQLTHSLMKQDPRAILNPKAKSEMCAPIIVNGQRLGVLVLDRHRTRVPYLESDRQMAYMVSAILGIYLYRSPLLMAARELPRAALEDNKEFAFVLMPFRDPFNKYYETIIKPAIRQAGLLPIRADEIYQPSEIIKDIYEFIAKARIVVAELTDRNPNVMYELGYSHAVGKTAIMITQAVDDIPFDLRGYRCIVYDTTDPDWSKQLENKITMYIKTIQ